MRTKLSLLLAGLIALGSVAQAVQINGQLEKAGLERLASDPTGFVGRVFYDTALERARIYKSTGGWATLSTGDVSSNTATSVDSEIALFSSTTGKLIKRASGTGIATLTSGVLSATATTGTGNVVLSASPTVSGTMNAGAITMSSGLIVGGNTTSDSNLGTISSVTKSAYYEGSFSVTFGGASTPFSSNQSPTIKYVKDGSVVTLFFPRLVVACSVAGQPIRTPSVFIPSSLRPAVQTYGAVFIHDNSAWQTTMGQVAIYTSGQIDIQKTVLGANYTAAGNCGYEAFNVTYTLN